MAATVKKATGHWAVFWTRFHAMVETEFVLNAMEIAMKIVG